MCVSLLLRVKVVWDVSLSTVRCVCLCVSILRESIKRLPAILCFAEGIDGLLKFKIPTLKSSVSPPMQRYGRMM